MDSVRPTNFAQGGIVDNAVNFYDEVIADNKDRSGFMAGLKSVSARAAKGLIGLSGLHEVEKSAGELGHDVGRGADGWTVARSGGMLAVNSALSAASFLPAGKAVAGLAKGEKLMTTAKAGTQIAGVTGAGKTVAGQVADDVGGAVARTVGQGGKGQTGALLDDLGRVGDKYGVRVRQGGNVGESVGTVDDILVNTRIGGDHEIVHAAQQLQTRATLLESHAQKLGKSAKDLTAAERAQVAPQVQAFERGAYQHHEMWAKEATGFGGKASSGYGQAVQANVDDFSRALADGVVPQGPSSVVSRAYGNLPNAVGTSQGQIATNLGAIQAGVINSQRQE